MNTRGYAIIRTADGIEILKTDIRHCMSVQMPIVPEITGAIAKYKEIIEAPPPWRYREYELVNVIQVPIFEEKIQR